MGYYFLHINSKKHRGLSTDSSKARVSDGGRASTTRKEKSDGTQASVADGRATIGFGGRKKESVACEKTVVVETFEVAPAGQEKAVEPVVVEVVKSSMEVEDPSVGADVLQEITPVPKNTLQSSPRKTAKSSAMVEKPVVLELSKPPNESPRMVLESPKEVAVIQRKITENSEDVVVSLEKAVNSTRTNADATEVVADELLKQAPVSPVKALVSLKKSPNKVSKATSALNSITTESDEDYIVAQAVIETASAFTDEFLQESLENIALEHEEYVQVDLTRSMMLSQSTSEVSRIDDVVETTPEASHIKGPAAKTEETVPAGEEGVTKETIVEESIVEESIVEESVVEGNSVEESIVEESAVEECNVEESTVVESIVEEKREQVLLESHISAGVEPVIDATAAVETSAPPPGSPDGTPLSWESIVFSPELQAESTEETLTPLSLDTEALDTPAENIDSTESLSIQVPAENTEAHAEDKDASSPVDSGGSTPNTRNRNRAKKAKSKKKKSKKHH
uniref:Uncharacterized protein n=1 Tax=Hyaloperonospora arabidopsidis (strain Emoy2) TaxID=559515 RepID=M4BZC3_HYAAE